MHALELARDCIRTRGPEARKVEIIVIKAGGPLQVSRLIDWSNKGANRLRSAAAVGIITHIQRLADEIQRPMVLCSADERREYKMDPPVPQNAPQNVIAVSKYRFLQGVLPN